MKVCNSCNKSKPFSEFNKSKSNAGGLRPQCKECLRKIRVQQKQRNEEKKRSIYEEHRIKENGIIKVKWIKIN